MDIAEHYARTFMEVLKEHSVNKKTPVLEWSVVRVSYSEHSKCICTNEIAWKYHIKNFITDEELIIGSECVKRWGVSFPLHCSVCSRELKDKINRAQEKKLVCPSCTRDGDKILTFNGPWKGMKFSDVLKNIAWTTWIVNKAGCQNSSVLAFKSYARLTVTSAALRAQT
jgi:hypothetical protein